MADYFTQFSVMFPVGGNTDVEAALALYREFEEQLDRDEGTLVGFTAEAVEDDPASLWLYSDGHGEPEHVIAFAKQCGEAFGLSGRVGLLLGLVVFPHAARWFRRWSARPLPRIGRHDQPARLRALVDRPTIRSAGRARPDPARRGCNRDR